MIRQITEATIYLVDIRAAIRLVAPCSYPPRGLFTQHLQPMLSTP